MRFLVTSVALVVACTARAQAPAPDVAWPREAKAADGTVITVYQPQVERWADNTLSGRAAVSVKRPGEKEPHYGVIELSARTEIDKSADVATLSSVRITKSSFPGASPEEAEKYLATLRASVTKAELAGIGAGAAGQSRDRAGALAEGAAGEERPAADPVPHRALDAGGGRRRAGAARREGCARAAARHQHHRADLSREVFLHLLPAGARPLVAGEGAGPASGSPGR